MAKEQIIIKMEMLNMMVNIKMINLMEMVNGFMKMVIIIQANIKMD